MKYSIVLFCISLFVLCFVLSCETSDPVSSDYSIYNSWYKRITDSQGNTFNAELKFNDNNSYDFIVHGEPYGHTDSFAEFELDNNLIRIVNDADCDLIGIYEYVFSQDKLVLIASDDGCAPRAAALQGVWYKTKPWS